MRTQIKPRFDKISKQVLSPLPIPALHAPFKPPDLAGPIKLSSYGTIIDPANFVLASLTALMANSGNSIYLLY